jgi:recombination protein RecT
MPSANAAASAAAKDRNKQHAHLLTPAEKKPPTISDFLRSKKAVIEQALEGTALTPERLLSVTMTEMRKNPQLQECTQASLFGALVQAAQLGLEPGAALGHCYLLPYKNRKLGVVECQFQLGYRGMIDLSRRSGKIVKLSAHCVFEKDTFSVSYGLDEALEHTPFLEGPPGEVLGAYAVAHLAGGGIQWVYLPRHKLDAIKGGSPSGNRGPWVSHFEEMCQKTAARALFKWLPVSIEAQTAVGLDSMADAGETQDIGAMLDQGVVVDEAGVIVEGSVKSATDLNSAL